jgi:hypothetical protein
MSTVKMPKAIDFTMLSTFLRCKRRYYYRMVRNLVGKKPPTAAEFGRCIHKALDEWYKSKDDKKAIDIFANAFKEDPEDDKRTIEIGKKLLEIYFSQYANQNITVLASELSFDLPMPVFNDVNYIGRIDKIIEWDGAVYVMDHKTTSRLGFTFFYKIKPNMQFTGYVWAAQQLGQDRCSGVVLDALLVAKGLLTSSARAKLTPVARDIATYTHDDIAEWKEDVASLLDDIAGCYQKDKWCRNTEGCTDFVECPYRRICKEDRAIREAIIKQDYKEECWDPRRKDD